MLDFLNPLYAKTDKEILAEIGSMLRNKRIQNNLTQQDFANSIGISKDQLSKIERTGKTSLATLIAISRKFELLNQLLSVYETPELTPFQEYKIEQKIQKLKTKRIRVRK